MSSKKSLSVLAQFCATGVLVLSLSACDKASTQPPIPQAAHDVPQERVHATVATPQHVAPPSARPVHWGYSGHHGPEEWAALSPAYAACDKGVMQSPVDIKTDAAATANAFSMSYGNSLVKVSHHEHVDMIVDNGHTIQVTVEEGSTLTTAKDSYQLKQFHYHTPSEHRVDGKQFPMEVHFVHQSESGAFAVMSSFFVEGAENAALANVIAHFPSNKGGEEHIDEAVDLSLHLPHNETSYHFFGSFTTPPCTENVEWIVLEHPVTASREQLAAFEKRLNKNNRPLQVWHERSLSVNKIDTSGE